jgi:hypothetical protein
MSEEQTFRSEVTMGLCGTIVQSSMFKVQRFGGLCFRWARHAGFSVLNPDSAVKPTCP